MHDSRGIVRCALAAVLFGASAPAASVVADELSPFALAGLLYLGAALAVAPLVLRAPPSRPALRRGASRLSIAVLAGGAVGPVLLAAGLRRTSAASASLLLNLELVFTVIIAAMWFHEHLGRRVVTGTALVAVAGVLLASGSLHDARWGALMVAGACLMWAVDNTVTAALDELRPAHITFAKGAIAGSANLVLGLALADGLASVGTVAWALVVGAIGYGASITLWVSGARELGAARGQLVFALAPFIGAALSWTVLDEKVETLQLVALVIALVGVGFVTRTAHEHQHEHGAMEHDHAHDHPDPHHTHEHADGFVGRHQHPHAHEPLVHSHPHVPDLHHHHGH